MLKTLVRRVLGRFGYGIVSSDLLNYQSQMIQAETELGHHRSFAARCSVDAAGDAIPWFTYCAFQYLDQLDLSQCDVLEWGCGNSSLYFMRRARSIVSIEHDRDWYEQMRPHFQGAAELILEDEEGYAQKPSQDSMFDLIVVDGIQRKQCLEQAVQHLREGGMIVLDNSDRYPQLCQSVRQHGLLQVDFHGHGPINTYPWTTTVFYSDLVGFPPRREQPVVPVGGGY